VKKTLSDRLLPPADRVIVDWIINALLLKSLRENKP
jgi:hypothetical protein